MREVALSILNGSVPGRVTTWEVPSSEPQSRPISIPVKRPFICPVDDCESSYRRKDHLNRHLLQHQGKLFECPVENCGKKFAVKGNMSRHVTNIHKGQQSKSMSSAVVEEKKEFVCPEIGCGKVFKYESRLRRHENMHVKLDSVEVFCSEPGCMKNFSNDQCLKAHLRSCHSRVICEICGSKQLKKNMKRHIRTHGGSSPEKIMCNFKGCQRSFSSRSNLRQHVNAVHRRLKPYVCSIPGCGMRFSFKHVRDHHEKVGCHVYVLADFEEEDEQFRSRDRGGRKRKGPPTIETLLRKRVSPPGQLDGILDHGVDYLSWLLSS